MTSPTPLKFVVAPHIVEDLGLNLYTDLPRVLVEYVANAHDADSPAADLYMDLDRIRQERETLRQLYETEAKDESHSSLPLSERVLPDDVRIVIEDTGIGMSRDELQDKFLIAGRRRRQTESGYRTRTEKKQRPLMGRKGLGKLAGFGVAKRVEVISRKEGETHATRIVLQYDALVSQRNVASVDVPDHRLEDGGGFRNSGTRIVLSNLLYDPLKSRESTIRNEIGGHFEFVQPDDFLIRLNGEPVVPEAREHAFAWPCPDTVPVTELVEETIATDAGEVKYSYRIRFTVDRTALSATKRGVRVYVGHRLAAAPDLLDMDTNMHGFRMTDYLDGVLQADFLDQYQTDYISTDRQSLRWDTPLLAPLRRELSTQMKAACAKYQDSRERAVKSKVEDDAFTMDLIQKQGFSGRDRTLALRIATSLATASKRSVADPDYKTRLPIVIESIGHGSVLAEITKLADLDRPNLERLVLQVARLTRHELDHFVSYAKTRLKAIEALNRIVKAHDFRESENEKILQKLFESSPWLLDPTFTQFLTADQPENTVFKRLAKELEIGDHAPSGPKAKSKRPDLVFLIGNSSLARLVVVELKSANLRLDASHLNQLKYYMSRAEGWLKDKNRPMQVHGHLVGTYPEADTRVQDEVALRGDRDKAGPDCPWRVRDYVEVLDETLAAHHELVEIFRSLEEGESV